MNTIHHSYCNNCEKIGHTFSNCRKPLVSHGIITFRLGIGFVSIIFAIFLANWEFKKM